MSGGVSLITQHGDTGASLLLAAQSIGFGLCQIIATGDERAQPVSDALATLAEDRDTRVIAVCLDEVRDGPGLISALALARSRNKPVVIFKTGLLAEVRRPGSMPSGTEPMRVCQALFEQYGVIAVESRRELLDVALFLDTAGTALPAGTGVAILSGGGGGGVIASDLCAEYGLQVPRLSEATHEKLLPLVPPIASITNPIDLTPEMWQAKWYPNFPNVIDVIASDPNVHTVFFPSVILNKGVEEISTIMADFKERTDKAVLVAWNMVRGDGLQIFAEKNIFTFIEPGRALRALAKVIRARTAIDAAPADFPAAATASAARDLDENPEDAFRQIVTASGLIIAERKPVVTEDEAVAAARPLGYPVVLRGPAGDDPMAASLVEADLCDETEVRAAYGRVAAALAAGNGGSAKIVLHQGERAQAQLRIIAFRDPIFGPMVGCGAGGKFADVIDDFTLRRAPFDGTGAMEMLDRLRIVDHVRHMDSDWDANVLAACLANLSQAIATAPWGDFVLAADPIDVLPASLHVLDGGLRIDSR